MSRAVGLSSAGAPQGDGDFGQGRILDDLDAHGALLTLVVGKRSLQLQYRARRREEKLFGPRCTLGAASCTEGQVVSPAPGGRAKCGKSMDRLAAACPLCARRQELRLAVSGTGRARLRPLRRIVACRAALTAACPLCAPSRAPPRCIGHWPRSASLTSYCGRARRS